MAYCSNDWRKIHNCHCCHGQQNPVYSYQTHDYEAKCTQSYYLLWRQQVNLDEYLEQKMGGLQLAVHGWEKKSELCNNNHATL